MNTKDIIKLFRESNYVSFIKFLQNLYKEKE